MLISVKKSAIATIMMVVKKKNDSNIEMIRESRNSNINNGKKKCITTIK